MIHDSGLLVYSNGLQGSTSPVPFMSGKPAARQRGLIPDACLQAVVAPAASWIDRQLLHHSGIDVKQKMPGRIAFGMLASACLLLAACGTPPAKDFKGSWRPVNRFRAAPAEIPLHRHYTYFAAPIDGTLKSMLTRWASDTERRLDYQLNYDVTLYQAVAALRTTDVEAAAGELNAVYAAQGVRVAVLPDEILVTSTNHPTPSAANGSEPKAKATTP
ncbi:hypothetical protein [Rhodanobacter lindaniclasticus]